MADHMTQEAQSAGETRGRKEGQGWHELLRGQQKEARLRRLECWDSRLKLPGKTHSGEEVGGGQQRQVVVLGLLTGAWRKGDSEMHGHLAGGYTGQNKPNRNSWDMMLAPTQCQVEGLREIPGSPITTETVTCVCISFILETFSHLLS